MRHGAGSPTSGAGSPPNRDESPPDRAGSPETGDSSNRPGRALLVSLSTLQSDPRVLHQAEWLVADGYSVDTLGLGPKPSESVATHYELHSVPAWSKLRLVWVTLLYLLSPSVIAFRRLVRVRIPRGALTAIREGQYDLVVFGEPEFLPLVAEKKLFGRPRPHVHLDLREYRDPGAVGNTRWRALTRRFRLWTWKSIGSHRVNTRSTVARGIADLYAAELNVPALTVVRNIPDFENLQPTPVSPDRIRLVFHGMVSRARGLWELVDATRDLGDRFSITLMLTGDAALIEEIRGYAAGIEHITVVPPVPMREVARSLNEHDLEVILLPPLNTNLTFALPNKLFEAVQGCLGLVISDSPMMVEIVQQYGNGVVVPGTEAEDLRATLLSLSREQVQDMKDASQVAAKELNAEAEGRVFLDAVRATSSDTRQNP